MDESEKLFREAKDLARLSQFGGPGHAKTQKKAARLRRKAIVLRNAKPQGGKGGFSERVLTISDAEMIAVRKTQDEPEPQERKEESRE